MKKPTNKLSFQSAFSLVELLVVIAVIAVIAAIAISNISNITGSAKEATKTHNAQILSQAFSAYVTGAEASTNYSQATLAADRASVATAIAAMSAGRSVVDNFGITNTYTAPAAIENVATNKLTLTNGLLYYTP